MTYPEQSSQRSSPIYTTVVHAEEYWISRARLNIADYITYMTDGERPPAAHHIVWLREMLVGGERVILVAPRGSAKTDISLWLFGWWIGRLPYLTNYIGSVTFQQATLRLQEIRSTIEFNPRYQNVFPWIHIDSQRENSQKAFTVWSERWPGIDGAISYKTWRSMISRYGESKDATLFCSGMTAKGVVGRRFSGKALIDDAHDETNSATDEQCDKVEAFVKKTLMPCCVREATIDVIGTRWRTNDLIGRLKEDVRSVDGKKGEKIWKTIEMSALDEEGNSYWPSVYPVERLREIEDEVGGVIFRLMYMNDPDAATSEQFTLDMLRKPLPEPLPNFKEVVISVDLAFTKEKRSDYTVFTAMARDNEPRYNIYVLDIMRGKWNLSKDKIDQLVDFADRVSQAYGVDIDHILIHHQGSEIEFAGDVGLREAEEVERGVKDVQYDVKTVKTTGDKEERLKRGFAIKAQQGRVYFNMMSRYYNAAVSELLSFPAGHDDIVDTLTLPFQQRSWHFRGTSSGIVHAKSKYMI